MLKLQINIAIQQMLKIHASKIYTGTCCYSFMHFGNIMLTLASEYVLFEFFSNKTYYLGGKDAPVSFRKLRKHCN